jgi:hypothetical protein
VTPLRGVRPSRRRRHRAVVGHRHRASIFNNDSTLTSAILDRVLHHAETLVIEGESYSMKDRIEP